MTEAIDVLKESYLFKDLPEGILNQISDRLIIESYGPKEIIFREGSEGNEFYLIIEGSVEVRKRDNESGIEFHLTRLDAPGSFGEIALLRSDKRSATVATLEESRLAIFKSSDFQQLVEKIPEFSMSIARSLANRVDELSSSRRISYAQLSQLKFDPQVLTLLPKKRLMHLKAVPLGYNGSSLSVAMVHPDDFTVHDQLRQAIRGVMIEPIVVSENDFERFMATTYEDSFPTSNSHDKTGPVDINNLMRELEDDLQEIKSNEHDTVEFNRNLLIEAIRNHASELHLEPRIDEFLIRHRIHGQLDTVMSLSRSRQQEVIKRFKEISDLDPEQRTLPQQGSIQILDSELEISFMVDTLPTRYGEKMVVRMPETGSIPALEHLITTSEEKNRFSRLLTMPYGLILILGPSGSGKTTTQYSILRQLSRRNINAYAVGERISYEIAGVNRIDTGKGRFNMQRAMKGVLAQQPDLILLEELNDLETCHLAMNAAMTGHLVISTFAASDLDSALTRFQLMGGERATMIEALSGVVTQRLVRKLCPHCREPYTPDEAVLIRLNLSAGTTLYRSGKCTSCQESGFRGRVGVYDILALEAKHKDILMQPGGRLRHLDDEQNRSLRNSGLEVLKNGDTLPQELMRELML